MKVHEYQAKEIFGRYGIPIPNGKVAMNVDEVIAVSNVTGKENKMELVMTEKQYDDWRHGGVLIQNALPHLTQDEREFLISGVTPEEWDNLFGNPQGIDPHFVE